MKTFFFFGLSFFVCFVNVTEKSIHSLFEFFFFFTFSQMKNKIKELLKIILAKLDFPDRRGSHLDQTWRTTRFSFINPEYLNHKPLRDNVV